MYQSIKRKMYQVQKIVLEIGTKDKKMKLVQKQGVLNQVTGRNSTGV